MQERRTTSILQRVPVILAVTAASYGLVSQAQAQNSQRDSRARHFVAGAASAALVTLPGTIREEAALQD